MKMRFFFKGYGDLCYFYTCTKHILSNIEHQSGDMYETSYKLLNPTT